MIDHDRIIEVLYNEIKEHLSEKRLKHTENVLEKALELAEKYGLDDTERKKVTIAVLAHDRFRNTQEEGNALSHSKSAARHMLENYDIEDEDIINSLKYHTTGRPAMSLMEKIVFLADAIEVDRTYDGVEKIRKEAEKGLDQGVIASLMNTVEYKVKSGSTIDEDTLDALNYYTKEDNFGKER